MSIHPSQATGRTQFNAPDARPLVYRDLIVDYTNEGGVILLHPTEARWALSNETGLEITRLLDGSRSLQELALEFAQDSGTDPATILVDIQSFVEELYRCNLLENAPLSIQPEPVPSKPPSMTIYITEECNLRCKHCAIVEGKMPPTTLTSDEIRRLIDEHTTNYDNPTISFLGGEPLLRDDCLDLLDYAATKTTKTTISTNGHLVSVEIAERLATSGAQVQVSLDGADPEVHDFIRGKGSFEKAWGAIERICKAGGAQRLVIANVLTRSMLPHVKALVEKVDRIGPINTLRFLSLNKLKAAETNWHRIAPDDEEMFRIYKWLLFDIQRENREGKTRVSAGFPGFVPNMKPDGSPWCPLGETLIVNSQGRTYNCPVLNNGDYDVGSIRVEGLSAMLEGERNKALRKKILDRRYEIPECRVCAWRNFCQGGCAAFSSLRSGSLYVNDAYCDFRRDLYREMVKEKSSLPDTAD